MAAAAGPIVVLDSGVGGLTILAEMARLLPGERLIYVADRAWCPYGPRPAAEIARRVEALVRRLIAEEDARLVVLACNTATIAAIAHLRATFALPIVGVEPAVKPAAERTRSGIVGILATETSLEGEKFSGLVERHGAGVRVLVQPCPLLVELVERGEIDGAEVDRVVAGYVRPLVDAGADVLALGCTHFPFLRAAIVRAAGPRVRIVDTGDAVARRVVAVLAERGLARTDGATGTVELVCTGDVDAALFRRLWRPDAAPEPFAV